MLGYRQVEILQCLQQGQKSGAELERVLTGGRSSSSCIRTTLGEMCKQGLIQRVERGVYAIVHPTHDEKTHTLHLSCYGNQIEVVVEERYIEELRREGE